jgi:hypothetical protein
MTVIVIAGAFDHPLELGRLSSIASVGAFVCSTSGPRQCGRSQRRDPFNTKARSMLAVTPAEVQTGH